MSDTQDPALAQWRDAFEHRALPTPMRDRWQVLRAGVVNMWEFEAVEYWYANGWAQLMGRNETGKSTLMALTTLIPWLGDTASDKIDTLGRAGKQFAYYVRPTGDSDRRDNDASQFHGWLWVEYGRRIGEKPEFFTTLLYASARAGSSNTSLSWCTSVGSRVRGALLLTSGRAVRSDKEVKDVPGLERHRNAGSYRKEIASRLLGGSEAQLDTIGKLLKVTRQPKLGAQLKVNFVTEHLRDSLPELSRDEVTQLAQGWDQLDQLRIDLTRAHAAAIEVAQFERDAWRPWAGSLLRLHADDIAARQTALDAVTRQERHARKEVFSSQRREQYLTNKRDVAHTEAITAQGQARTLRDSTTYSEANQRVASLARAEREADNAKGLLDRASRAVQDAETRANAAEKTSTQRKIELDKLKTKLHEQEDTVHSLAREAGIACPRPLDPDLLQQSTVERAHIVNQVEVLRRKTDVVDQQARLADNTANTLEAIARHSKARADQAWQQAEEERELVAQAIDRWAPDQARDFVEGWFAALPRTTDLASHSRLSDLIRRDFYDPPHAKFRDHQARAHVERQALTAQAGELRRQIDDLSQETVTTPLPPQLWRRRDRSAVAGAPFWKLVNPRRGILAAELADLEAALAASGLLDAWISHEGGAELETFAAPSEGAATNGRLADLLVVAAEAGDLGELTEKVLASVSLVAPGEPLPTDQATFSVDGRWRMGEVSGRAGAQHEQAEWLGEAAREARRRRRVAELQDQLVQLETQIGAAQGQEQWWQDQLDELAHVFGQAPKDDDLHQSLVRCLTSEKSAVEHRAEADEALEATRKATAIAHSQRAQLRQAALEHCLEPTQDGLQNIQRAIDRARNELVRWRDRRAEHQRTNETSEQAKAEAIQCAKELTSEQEALKDDEQAHHIAKAKVDTLRATINANDQQIFDELTQLERGARAAETEREQLNQELSDVAAAKGRAEQKLQDVEQRRQVATDERAAAHREFRTLLDARLAHGLPVDIPDPTSSAVDQVRSQAAEVRRTLRPKGWNDSSQREAPQENRQCVERLRRDLDAKARDARAALEQSGRSIQVTPDGPIPSIEVTVNSNGLVLPLADAGEYLLGVHTELEGQYSESVRVTLERLLGSTFLEHLRDNIGNAIQVVDRINAVLQNHPTGTDGTTLRIRLEPESNERLLAWVSGSGLIDPDNAQEMRELLRNKVDEAKRSAANQGRADWTDSLASHLDYRQWYQVVLESRMAAGRWGPLTTRRYSELSGGARAVMLMLPLVAALAAQYDRLPSAPRPLWLDEAFDGLDTHNRSIMMSLLQKFDLDVLLAGPGRLVNIGAVPTAAIYQVVRAPAPEPGADLVAELWAGKDLQTIDLPLSWLDDSPSAKPRHDSLW